MTSPSFAELMADAQRRFGFRTQLELANHVGMSLRAVCNYLAGDSLPPAPRLPRLAKDLGIDFKDLVAVVSADRSRRSHPGIRIDTPEQCRAEISRRKQMVSGDREAVPGTVHAADPSDAVANCVPFAGPKIPHVTEVE